MESSRRKDILKDAGLDHSKERQEVEKAVKKEEERRQKKDEKRKTLLESSTFQTLSFIKKGMDNFMLDPIIGLVLPAAGDIISSILALPFLYFSLFKVKSIRLTLACLFNTIMDLLVGLVPIIGDVFDLFHRSYKKNIDMIVGYVNDDAEAIKQVKQKSMWIWLLILLFIAALMLLVKIISNIFTHF